MSTDKLVKANAALTDLAKEPGASVSKRLATLHAFRRHVDGLIAKVEGEDPTRNKNPISQVDGS